jgi:hypothetical protein
MQTISSNKVPVIVENLREGLKGELNVSIPWRLMLDSAVAVHVPPLICDIYQLLLSCW